VSEKKSPFLFLHGAWHGSWCWEPITRALSAAGHPTLAIDLPGHGLRSIVPRSYLSQDSAALATEVTPTGQLSAAEVSAPALEAVRELAAAHGPVTVVAHSLAGVCLHYIGEAAPTAVDRMVYLAALAPTPGRTVFEDAATPAFADSLFFGLPVSDHAATGVVRINWRSSDAEYLSRARQCFYGRVPDALAATASQLLTPDVPARLYSDTVELTAERWGSIPRTWIRCTEDLAVPVAAQDAIAAALDDRFPDRAFTALTLDTDHSPFLSAPKELVEALFTAIQ
jgi:pimeloyl-ACP methyl ester carboxylesterase